MTIKFGIALALVLAASVAAESQVGKVYRMGFLGLSSSEDYARNLQAFRQGLRHLGYEKGKNISIEYRWAQGRDERLLERLLAMPPASFEQLCMRVLRESGFIQVEVTERSGDGGIDRYGIVRLVGMLPLRVSFQCKRYRHNVGASIVRDFLGAMMGRAEEGLITTAGGFTRDARQEDTRDGVTAIDLIDGELLAEKLKELELGVRTKTVEKVEIDEQWFGSV